MGAQYEPGEMSFVPLVAVVFAVVLAVVLAVVFELVVVFVVVFAVVVVAVPALFDGLACVVVGATVERAVVDEATVVVVVVVVAGELEKTGAALQLAIVKDEHSLVNKFLIRPNSLWSIDRPHRAFTEIQSPKYVHQ